MSLKIIIFIAFSFQLIAFSSNADTIYTNEGKELKGIIVEEYKDRIQLSTVDGERTIMKSDIKELYFDTEEQNLIKLADQARDRGDLIKAFVYYDKAFKINPESKAAKDGIVFLQGYLFKKDMAQKEEVVRRHNEFEERGKEAMDIKSDEERLKDDIEKLRTASGISLITKDGSTQIEDVLIGSSAYEAGIRKGDELVAIWGRLVGYLSPEEVVEALLEKSSLETKCTVERSVDLSPADLMGVNFKMEFDGMTVWGLKEDSAALKQNDIIVSINGKPTRYMPLKKAIELIKKSKNNTIKLAFRRKIIMWGKEGR